MQINKIIVTFKGDKSIKIIEILIQKGYSKYINGKKIHLCTNQV